VACGTTADLAGLALALLLPDVRKSLTSAALMLLMVLALLLVLVLVLSLLLALVLLTVLQFQCVCTAQVTCKSSQP
jgi:hypothetical protein